MYTTTTTAPSPPASTTMTYDPTFVTLHEHQATLPYEYRTKTFREYACPPAAMKGAYCAQQFAPDANSTHRSRHTRVEGNVPGHSLPSTELYGTAPLMPTVALDVDAETFLRGMGSGDRDRRVTETQFYRPDFVDVPLEVEPFTRGGELTRVGLSYEK